MTQGDENGEWELRTPVAFFIYNRPETTRRVFEAIRQVKPPRLYVVADGPRGDRPGDSERCEAARALIDVDWDCKVRKNYSDVNLGCSGRVAGGLDWVFSDVEEAVVVEDDCLPHPSFFRFCGELLERYRDEDEVMSVTGQNVQFGRNGSGYSYYFSRFHHIWGWATWRRAWSSYDREMKRWPELKDVMLRDSLGNRRAEAYWRRVLQETYEGGIDSYAFRWMYSCWIKGGLGVTSGVNLVSNIGFGSDATHTRDSGRNPFANIPACEMRFPLRHPPEIEVNGRADEYTQNTLYDPTLQVRVKWKLRRTLSEVEDALKGKKGVA